MTATACSRSGVRAEDFFSKSPEATDRALRVCNGDDVEPACLFREACADYALRNREAGVWGGMTEGEREELARRRGNPYERPSLVGLVSDERRAVAHGTAEGVAFHRMRYMSPCAACQEFTAREASGMVTA
jgi:hypothetical protein